MNESNEYYQHRRQVNIFRNFLIVFIHFHFDKHINLCFIDKIKKIVISETVRPISEIKKQKNENVFRVELTL